MAELCFNTFNQSAWFGVDADLPGQLVAAADAGFRWWGPDVYSLDAWIASGHAVIELADVVRRFAADGGQSDQSACYIGLRAPMQSQFACAPAIFPLSSGRPSRAIRCPLCGASD